MDETHPLVPSATHQPPTATRGSHTNVVFWAAEGWVSRVLIKDTWKEVKQTCAFPRPNSMKHVDSSLSFDQAEVVDVVPVPSCRYFALGLLRSPNSLGNPSSLVGPAPVFASARLARSESRHQTTPIYFFFNCPRVPSHRRIILNAQLLSTQSLACPLTPIIIWPYRSRVADS